MVISCLIGLNGYAQKYSTAAGLRVDGDQLGITVKQRVFRTIALEGLLTGNDNEVRSTLLIENHFPLVGKGLNFYVGGGGHVGGVDDFGAVAGVDAIMGAELKVPLLRLLISADVKPAYNFVSEQQRLEYSTAISVRYVMGKEGKSQRKKARVRRQNKREKERTKSSKIKEREKQKRFKLKEKEKTKRAKYKEKTKRLKEKNKAKRKKQKEKDKKTFRDWKVWNIFKSEER
ncbi:hypothetical protein [Tunicatimonas pelagia]|uniref:hypothetical protein n=1 Tax=Tunicatimonas pelagia TaxID=931531 RepID=UPI002665783B|nr:hypothetical protein [Tunicatimonas pelagia]WKN40627.1 hypothetical protein P0M28_16435 [Tunicatimonas pelagia]